MFRSLSCLPCRALGALALLVLSDAAGAQSFSFLGRTVHYEIPSGFCSVSKVGGLMAAELESQRRMLQPNVKLVEVLAPCGELAQANKGELAYFSTWMQLQVLTPKGREQTVDASRSQFVRSASGSMKTLDTASVIRQLEDRIKQVSPDKSFEGTKVDVAGADDDALYLITRTLMRREDVPAYEVLGVTAVTLANRVPMNVASYQALSKVPDRSVASKNMRWLLSSVLKN